MKIISLAFSLGLTAIAAAALTTAPAFASKGADDPAGHVRGNDKGGHGADDGPNHTMLIRTPALQLMARKGADDPAGDDRGGGKGGHGADDAPNHG